MWLPVHRQEAGLGGEGKASELVMPNVQLEWRFTAKLYKRDAPCVPRVSKGAPPPVARPLPRLRLPHAKLHGQTMGLVEAHFAQKTNGVACFAHKALQRWGLLAWIPDVGAHNLCFHRLQSFAEGW